MRKILILVAISIVCQSGWAQDAKQLINEGIELHDKGQYEDAIKKYDEALRLEPGNFMAMYEKSYSLLELKKYDDATVYLKKILDECKESELRKLSFMNFGTILDYQGKGKESVAVYEKGIKEFPDNYLLHFNKGVTQNGLKENDAAYASFQQSARLNPFHASSHQALATLMVGKNRIPAILSYFTFLIMEPTGQRAKTNVESLKGQLMKGISKNDQGNTVISMDAAALDKKNKKIDDDFSAAEMMVSLVGADNSLADTLGAKTEADRLDVKLQLLINVIEESNKKDKGFYKSFYVPMFKEMKKQDFTKTACYIVLVSTGDSDINDWIEKNEDQVEKFYAWLEGYKWVKE